MFCRIRPIAESESFNGSQPVAALDSSNVLLKLSDNKSKTYTFDKVFSPGSSQGKNYKNSKTVSGFVSDRDSDTKIVPSFRRSICGGWAGDQIGLGRLPRLHICIRADRHGKKLHHGKLNFTFSTSYRPSIRVTLFLRSFLRDLFLGRYAKHPRSGVSCDGGDL